MPVEYFMQLLNTILMHNQISIEFSFMNEVGHKVYLGKNSIFDYVLILFLH